MGIHSRIVAIEKKLHARVQPADDGSFGRWRLRTVREIETAMQAIGVQPLEFHSSMSLAERVEAIIERDQQR